MKRYIPAAVMIMAAGQATGLLAQENEQAYDLDEIIVSGGFTPVEAEKYGRSATVITNEEIKERGITTVRDALRAVPGVSVSETGGNLTQVRIRGGEANHTLVLIDGVEAAAGDGEYFFSGLEATNIERIEVLRGPQSVFYGSNASSGVINIITRTGGLGANYGLSLETGSHGNARAAGFASYRNERGGVSVSLSENYDRGWDYSGDNGERDKTDRHTAIIKGDYALTDALTVGASYRYSKEDYDFDREDYGATDADTYIVDNPDYYGDVKEQGFNAFAEYEMLDGRLMHRLSYELTKNKRKSITPLDFNPKTREKTKTKVYKYLLSFGIDGAVDGGANHLINFLAEHEKDSSDTNSDYDRKSDSVGLEYRGSFDFGLDLQAGIRYDDNKVFKNQTTWNVGASYTFQGTGIRLHASAGEGVVNPTYGELYSQTYYAIGNPDLKPETNRSYDVGIELPFHGDRGVIDVTYFRERLKNEITYAYDGTNPSYYNEDGKSKRQGVEVEGRYEVTDNINLHASYTYLDAKNNDGSRELRRPRHEFALGVIAEALDGRLSGSAHLRHVAKNKDTLYIYPAVTKEMPNYTVVDLAARYGVTDQVDATLRVDNVFDKKYSDVWGYRGRDRTFYVGLDANW